MGDGVLIAQKGLLACAILFASLTVPTRTKGRVGPALERTYAPYESP